LTVYYGVKLDHQTVKTVKLDDANKKLAIRFTARETKTVVKVHIAIRAVSNSPTYRIGLQNDINGNPSGTWLGSNTFTPVSSPNFNEITLDKPVTLTESNKYHIVMEHEDGTIGASNYAQPLTVVQTPVYLFPDAFEDSNYDALLSTDGGTSWSSLGYQTSWLIEYSDGEGYGQPYNDQSWNAIYGDNWFAERIAPTSRIIVSSVEVNVRKVGTPPDSLYLVLYNISDDQEEDSVTISESDIGTSFAYVSASFNSKITLLPTKTYRLILKSPGSDSSNYYDSVVSVAFHPTNQIYEKTSWGGQNNYDQKSTDGGSSWSDFLHRDRLVKFVQEFNPAIKTSPNSGL